MKFFKTIYFKLVRINDSPQRIAIGLGLGVFTGILPFAGPIAALVLASLFKVNRASALIGSLITNTWLSVVALVLSIKIGSGLVGLDWHDVYGEWQLFMNTLQWRHFFLQYKIVLAIIAGYLAIAAVIGVIAYIAGLLVMKYIKRRR